MRLTRNLLGVVVVAAAVALAGCAATAPVTPASSATPIGGDIVAPVTMSANDLQGATVDLVVGQVLNITTGDLAVESYTGEVSDPEVATFVAGREEDGTTFNPGITAIGAGSAAVTLTNADGGIQPLAFTVVVRAK
jgi:hypothetical protein